MNKHFKIDWVLRRQGPAESPPDENFPYGIAQDFTNGKLPACTVKLTYPAPGVGSWVVVCKRCGFQLITTAAGRADDPTQVKIPCKSAIDA